VSDYQVGGSHYIDLPVQPWDVMRAIMSPDEFRAYLRGNVIKYIMRDKNGLEDLLKAKHYLSVLIEESQSVEFDGCPGSG
jgi:hypothetical protein